MFVYVSIPSVHPLFIYLFIYLFIVAVCDYFFVRLQLFGFAKKIII